MGAQRAGAPVLTGSVPPLPPVYHARQETGFGLADGLRPGETSLLVPALLGTGGTGKTQLALGLAHTVWSARAVDLLAWVPGQPERDHRGLRAGRGRPGPAARRRSVRHRRQCRAALPRLGAQDRAPLDGGARRRGLPRRSGRAVAAGPRRAGRGDHPAQGIRARPRPGFRRDRARCRRVQQEGGARLPQCPAHQLSRPADRGARPGRGPQRPADRARPGQRGGHRDRHDLQGLPDRVRTAHWHHHGHDHRRLPPVAARHLVARGGACPQAAAGRAVLACPGVRLRLRHQRHPGGRPHLSRRLRLHRRPARCRSARCRSARAGRRGPSRRGAGQHGAGQARPGRRRAEPGAVGLRQPGPVRPAQPGQHKRGAHGLAPPDGAGRGPRLPGRRQRRAGRGGGRRRAGRSVARAGHPREQPAAEPGAARLRRRAARLLRRPALEAGRPPGAASGGHVAD